MAQISVNQYRKMKKITASDLIEYNAKTLSDLVDYYCYRCSVGLYNCKISACDCNKIRQDRDYEQATMPKAIKGGENVRIEGIQKVE